MDKSEQIGVIFPEILIPNQKINTKKWAVVACDQFTSDKDYWVTTSRIVGGSPSALHIIVPEVFLKDNDLDERVEHAKDTMTHYIEDGVLVRLPRGVVLVERETAHGTRVGLMLAVDLDKYETDHTKKPLIRATEKTVEERIPPRMMLREDALLECPHVMLMLNDPDDTVISQVYRARGNAAMIYDTPLMQDGGHVKGWFIDDHEVLDGITQSLLALKEGSPDGMLFAVGDGNHSLASAKAVWDKKKEEMSDDERAESPLRYALVEVVNLYDRGISIHPIHRVLFGVEAPNALRMLVSILNSMGAQARMMYTRGANVHRNGDTQSILFESKMSKGRIELMKPQHDLITVTLTKALDKLLKEMPKAEIDYIHGDDVFHELSKEHGCLGFMMAPMKKDELFDAVEKLGVLPRKAFSLGSAEEKRYYLECRLLVDADEGEEEETETAPTEDVMPDMDSVETADVSNDIDMEIVTEEAPQEDKRTLRKKRRFGRKRD